MTAIPLLDARTDQVASFNLQAASLDQPWLEAS